MNEKLSAVIEAVDSHGDLLAWAKAAPYCLFGLVVLLWPVVVLLYLSRRGE